MPKLEPKSIQRELDQGLVWPVYWIFGQEKMKSRELLKRIRKTALGLAEGEEGEKSSILSLSEETFDGTETSTGTILDAAQSMALGGGTRFIVVREAHALKEAETLAPLLGPRANARELGSVTVFLAKDLDARKKFSKLLIDKAAVVACDEVTEEEREPWIQYLAKRRGLVLPPEFVAQIASLDPWSLDIVDQELEKYSLASTLAAPSQAAEVLLGGVMSGGTDAFLEAFFSRNLKEALQRIESFAERPDDSLPLLGLMGWNARHLVLLLAEQQAGKRTLKLNPYVADKLRRWSRNWSLSEAMRLQGALAEIDFQLKQTPLLPLGSWVTLAHEFAK